MKSQKQYISLLNNTYKLDITQTQHLNLYKSYIYKTPKTEY